MQWIHRDKKHFLDATHGKKYTNTYGKVICREMGIPLRKTGSEASQKENEKKRKWKT